MKKNMKISVLRNQIFVLASCLLLCGAVACGSSGDQPADVEKETGEEAKQKPASFEITNLAGTPSDYSSRENRSEERRVGKECL